MKFARINLQFVTLSANSVLLPIIIIFCTEYLQIFHRSFVKHKRRHVQRVFAVFIVNISKSILRTHKERMTKYLTQDVNKDFLYKMLELMYMFYLNSLVPS